MTRPYLCACCGRVHDGFAALAFAAPAPWDWATDDERAVEWTLQSDFCVHERDQFYVRAVLVVPIAESEQTLEFGVWSSLSEANFKRYSDSFNDDDQSKLGPMFGWFCNALPDYPDTMGLKCEVVPRDGGQRPLIELEPTEHPLSVHQHLGISMDEATRYYHAHVVGH